MSLNTFYNFFLFAVFSSALTKVACDKSSIGWKTIQPKDLEGLVMKYLPAVLENSLKNHEVSKARFSVMKGTPFRFDTTDEYLPDDLNLRNGGGHGNSLNDIQALSERTAGLLEIDTEKNFQFRNGSKSNKIRNEPTNARDDIHAINSKPIVQKRESTGESLPRLSAKIKRIIPKLARKLEKVVAMKNTQQQTPSLDADEERHAVVTLTPQQRQEMKGISLECLSPCDVSNDPSKTCWFNRQIGDTITFSVRIHGAQSRHWKNGKLLLQWERKRHIRDSDKYVTEKLFPETTSNGFKNVMVGSGGSRLRISPIEDGDVDMNCFTVSVNAVDFDVPKNEVKISEITFRVDILPIDMGFVYLGEELTIDIKRFITLPENTYKFQWRMEKVYFTSLPPNMRVVNNGQVLFITELSKEQEGIVVCSMYSKDDLFLTKRRFLIRSPVLPTSFTDNHLIGNKPTSEDTNFFSSSSVDPEV